MGKNPSKKYKTIYVVNFKETTIDENMVQEVDCGTCDLAYNDEKSAIQKCWELSDDVFNDHLDELDGDPNAKDILYRDCKGEGDYICVHYMNNTYEYWVSNLDIEI